MARHQMFSLFLLMAILLLTRADDINSGSRPKRQPQLLGGLLQGVLPGPYGYGYPSQHGFGGFGGFGHHRPSYGGHHHHHHHHGHHSEHHHHGHHHHDD